MSKATDRQIESLRSEIGGIWDRIGKPTAHTPKKTILGRLAAAETEIAALRDGLSLKMLDAQIVAAAEAVWQPVVRSLDERIEEIEVRIGAAPPGRRRLAPRQRWPQRWPRLDLVFRRISNTERKTVPPGNGRRGAAAGLEDSLTRLVEAVEAATPEERALLSGRLEDDWAAAVDSRDHSAAEIAGRVRRVWDAVLAEISDA